MSPSSSIESRLSQYDEIAKVLDVHAPLVAMRTVLRPVAPWFGEKELSLRLKLRKLERIARSSIARKCWRKFVASRQAFRRALILAQSLFYNNQIQERSSDPKALWRFMDQLVGRNRVTDSLPPAASLKRAIAFGEFFSAKIRLLRESMDAEVTLEDDPPVLSDTSSPMCLESFNAVYPADVARVIM